MSFADFESIVRPKRDGTANLIKALRTTSLDTFILLSSCVSIVGGEGQANYSAGNGYIDSIAHKPFGDKTRFVTLDLGMIEETDHTTDSTSRQRLSRQGVALLKIDDVNKLVQYALSPESAQQGTKQFVYGLDTKQIPPWILTLSTGNALFSHILPTTGSISETTDNDPDVYLRQMMHEFRNPSKAQSLIVKVTAMKIASLLSLSAEDLNCHSLLADLGLDSLVTIQLRNWIRVALEAFLKPVDIINAVTLGNLASLIYESSDMAKRLKST